MNQEKHPIQVVLEQCKGSVSSESSPFNLTSAFPHLLQQLVSILNSPAENSNPWCNMVPSHGKAASFRDRNFSKVTLRWDGREDKNYQKDEKRKGHIWATTGLVLQSLGVAESTLVAANKSELQALCDLGLTAEGEAAAHLWWGTGTYLPENLWKLHPWKCSRQGWTGFGVTWFSVRCPCPWRGLKQDDCGGHFLPKPSHDSMSLVESSSPSLAPLFTSLWGFRKVKQMHRGRHHSRHQIFQTFCPKDCIQNSWIAKFSILSHHEGRWEKLAQEPSFFGVSRYRNKLPWDFMSIRSCASVGMACTGW